MIHRLHNPSAGILLVRIAIAAAFIYAGWMKVADMGMTIGFFKMIGIPGWMAVYVGYLEFLGGIAMLLGIFVRYLGILFVINMIVAIFKVHITHGFGLQNNGYEFALVLLLLNAAMVTVGAGSYSLAHWWAKRKDSAGSSSMAASAQI